MLSVGFILASVLSLLSSSVLTTLNGQNTHFYSVVVVPHFHCAWPVWPLLQDFNLLQGNHEDNLRIDSATKQHEGIYTCICTWTHNNKVYNSSGSRELIFKGGGAFPLFFENGWGCGDCKDPFLHSTSVVVMTIFSYRNVQEFV